MAVLVDPDDNGANGGPSRAPRLEDHVFKLLGLAVLFLLAIGTVVFRILEDWGWIDSFYFSAIALTTVGFGDLTPTRDASKLVAVAYIFFGVALLTAYLTERLRRLPDRIIGHRSADRS